MISRFYGFVFGLLLLGSLQVAETFPLKIGSRWTYVSEGRVVMILDALGLERPGVEDVVRMQVRGRSFFWLSDDLFLCSNKEGLKSYGICETVTPPRKYSPLLLLDPPLVKEKTWRCQSFTEFTVTVRDREHITVPAGSFDAWKLEYVHTSERSSDPDLRAWFAPGVGFVKIESWQGNGRVGREGPKTPLMLELSKYEAERRGQPVVQPTLPPGAAVEAERLIGVLAHEQAQAREKAAAELLALGRAVIPLVGERVGKATDPEIRSRLEEVLRKFPKLELLARVLKEKGKVGEPLPVVFSLKNISTDKVYVLPTLSGNAARFPRYLIEIINDKGEVQRHKPVYFLGYGNPLRVRDFVLLKAGEETDPFGPGSFGHPMLAWVPDSPGTYSVHAIYDPSGDIPDAWKGAEMELDVEAEKLLRGMPRGRVSSNSIAVIVDR